MPTFRFFHHRMTLTCHLSSESSYLYPLHRSCRLRFYKGLRALTARPRVIRDTLHFSKTMSYTKGDQLQCIRTSQGRRPFFDKFSLQAPSSEYSTESLPGSPKAKLQFNLASLVKLVRMAWKQLKRQEAKGSMQGSRWVSFFCAQACLRHLMLPGRSRSGTANYPVFLPRPGEETLKMKWEWTQYVDTDEEVLLQSKKWNSVRDGSRRRC